jgi:hypothetical protein
MLFVMHLFATPQGAPAQELQRPPFYGLFLTVGDEYQELRANRTGGVLQPPVPGAGRTALPGTEGFDYVESISNVVAPPSGLSIVMYDRSLRGGLPETTLHVSRRVAHVTITDAPGGGADTKDRGVAVPFHRWVIGDEVDSRIAPVPDEPDMIKIVPVFRLEHGVYVLKVGDDLYDFSVGSAEELADSDWYSIIVAKDGAASLEKFVPAPLHDIDENYVVQHVDPSVRQFCVGYLYVLDDRIRFAAGPAVHSQSHGFDRPCGEIKEARKNRMYGSKYGAFHIKFNDDANYNFILAESDTVPLAREDMYGIEVPTDKIEPESLLERIAVCMGRQP